MIYVLEVLGAIAMSWAVTALFYYGLAKLVGYKDHKGGE